MNDRDQPGDRGAKEPDSGRDRGTTMNRIVGENVRRRRRRLKMTQKELAYLSQVHTGFISEIENGHANPSVKTLDAIALALNTEPMMLFNQHFWKKKTLERKLREDD
ncbi:MAG: helix-turn-helix transcriptional regulator [Paracoccaceae bacterium]|nr:helix-turn-helix transcriptional regulator [Paracoccaceae bacterium]